MILAFKTKLLNEKTLTIALIINLIEILQKKRAAGAIKSDDFVFTEL